MKAVLVTVATAIAGNGTPASPNGTLIVAGGKSSGPGYPMAGILLVPTGGQTVYVGGPDVDTTNGFPVAAGGTLNLELVSESLYGVVTATTQVVNVLRRYD